MARPAAYSMDMIARETVSRSAVVSLLATCSSNRVSTNHNADVADITRSISNTRRHNMSALQPRCHYSEQQPNMAEPMLPSRRSGYRDPRMNSSNRAVSYLRSRLSMNVGWKVVSESTLTFNAGKPEAEGTPDTSGDDTCRRAWPGK